MEIEKFKEELFMLLTGARNIDTDGFFSVSKHMFSSPETIEDMRAYMDSEMQKMAYVKPNFCQYVICRSTADELVFFDAAPVVKEYSNGIDIIYRWYNCDTDSVEEIIAKHLILPD